MAQVTISSAQDSTAVVPSNWTDPAAPPLVAFGPTPRRGAILVVEDRDDVRKGLAQLLELNGFIVRDAATGEQALRYLSMSPHGFALILLDLLLPGAVSGRELRARQLADAQVAAVPTIVVSACEPEQLAQSQLRPTAWLEKPFRIDVLLSIVRQHVVPERA